MASAYRNQQRDQNLEKLNDFLPKKSLIKALFLMSKTTPFQTNTNVVFFHFEYIPYMS